MDLRVQKGWWFGTRECNLCVVDPYCIKAFWENRMEDKKCKIPENRGRGGSVPPMGVIEKKLKCA